MAIVIGVGLHPVEPGHLEDVSVVDPRRVGVHGAREPQPPPQQLCPRSQWTRPADALQDTRSCMISKGHRGNFDIISRLVNNQQMKKENERGCTAMLKNTIPYSLSHEN